MNQHIITLAALGPDDAGQLTFAAYDAMTGAQKLVLRTQKHGVAAMLKARGIAFDTLDALYEQCEDFDELCACAARRLIELAEQTPSLCYAVSDPASDATVRALRAMLPQTLSLRVVGGLSLADCAAAAAICWGVNTENLRTLTALSLEDFRPEADSPQVITEIDNRCLAGDVKLWLGDLFDDETTVYFLENASCAQARPIALCELDRQPHYDHRTAVLVPAVSVFARSRATYEDFVRVVRRLRAPGGCPWDRAQTFHTLTQYMVEEACEAAEAMEQGQPDKIADELGDVLFQVVLNSCIGAEHRDFTDRDVTSMAAHKMITRHAYVFGGETVDNAGELNALWEKAKKKERGEQTALERVRDVAVSLPALSRTQKCLRRMAQAKADQDSAQAALREAMQALEKHPDEAHIAELLMALCALSDAVGVDAETALRTGLERRIRRLEEEA